MGALGSRWIACTALALALACSPASSLSVDVRTDWVPGEEFVGVRAELLDRADARGVPTLTSETLAPRGTVFLDAHRVAEWSPLSRGDHGLRVTLFDREGAVIARRFAVVTVADRTLITVDLTRNCEGLVCPIAGGDPTLTECVGARCVSPRCARESPGSCGAPACTSSDTCTTATCAEGACTDGACFAEAHDERCAPAEWCSPDAGCLPRTDLDAGTMPSDAGPRIDAARSDGGEDAYVVDAGCGVRPDPRGDGSLRFSSGLYCPSGGLVSAPYACVEGSGRIDLAAGEELTIEVRGPEPTVIGGAGIHPTGPGAILHVTTASTAPVYVALDLRDAPLEIRFVASQTTITFDAIGSNELTLRDSTARSASIAHDGPFTNAGPYVCTSGCSDTATHTPPPGCAP